MSRYIKHPDPDLKKKLMNARYNKAGCFYLRIEILDFNSNAEIVGDAAVGLPALAEVLGRNLKNVPDPEGSLEFFIELIRKNMECD